MESQAQLVMSRVFNAPRQLVFRAFTEPAQLAARWCPIGNTLPDAIVEA